MATNSKSLHFAIILFALASCGKKDGYSLLGNEDKKYIYMSTSNANGAFTTTAVADAKCMSDSRYPGSGTYKAMVVNATRRACSTNNCSGGISENLDWVFKPDTTYYRLTDDALIGTTDVNGLMMTPLDNGWDAGPSWSFWTGLTAQWTTSTDRCTNWTSNSPFVYGMIGLSDKLDSDAYAYNTPSCSSSIRFICVEQ